MATEQNRTFSLLNCYTFIPVISEMGNRLCAGEISRCVASHPGQLSLAVPRRAKHRDWWLVPTITLEEPRLVLHDSRHTGLVG